MLIRATVAMLLAATSVYGGLSTASAATPLTGSYTGTVTIPTSCYIVSTLCGADFEGEGVSAEIGRSTLSSGRLGGGSFCPPYPAPQTYVLSDSRSNSLTLAYQVTDCQFSGDVTTETGTWIVQDGAGRFAGVRGGSGTYTAIYSIVFDSTGTFPFSLSLDGSIVR